METTQKFVRFQCWRDERVPRVINTEAISVELPDFLATHTPLAAIRYERSPHPTDTASEGATLAALEDAAAANAHIFMVVRGVPGTGKSHLIRWLKERYDAHRGGPNGPDVVILIERAQCSLRGTLQQIVERMVTGDIFDARRMREILGKLERAESILDDAALDDRILNSFQAAAKAFAATPEAHTRSGSAKKVVDCVPDFLLDINVRAHLAGGPVERIKRFLQVGTRGEGSLRTDEPPAFTPEDFAFSVLTLGEIRGSRNPKARMLAEDLVRSADRFPALLAAHLNALFNAAIGELTQLRAGDVRELFDDVRRELRVRGKGLALFIEDITAFTGIDAALVDVLITQHTGESNRAFCRLTSVVGVTDGYLGQLPDNVQQRITHLLALSVPDAGRTEAIALPTAEAVAAMAARYLNAVRLPDDVLTEWVATGGDPAALPNACEECMHRGPCHAAFGTVDVAPEGDEAERLPVGLYPYNAHALNTLYRGVSTPNFKERTPRVLLSLVLSNFLQRHGGRVEKGDFPPPASVLLGDFDPPSLRPGESQRLRDNVPNEATRERFDTLLRIWGDGTAMVGIDAQGTRRFGGLSTAVLRAFNLPAPTATPVTQIRPPVRDNPSPPPVSPANDATTAPSTPPSVVPHVKDREELARWLAGAEISNHGLHLDNVIDLCRDAIDWEARGISDAQRNARLSRSALRIQGQRARANKDAFEFSRSEETFIFFEALLDLDLGADTNPATLARVLPTVREFLDTYEERIVAHVYGSEEPPLCDALVVDYVLLECLRGNPPVRGASEDEQLRWLLKTIMAEAPSGDLVEEARRVHGTQWVTLVRRLAPRIGELRKELSDSLNRPQGSASSVRFLDAAAALDALRVFNAAKWELLPTKDHTTGNARLAYDIYRILADHLSIVLESERAYQTESRDALRALLGAATPQAVFAEIAAVVKALDAGRVSFSAFKADEQLPYGKLSAIVSDSLGTAKTTPRTLLTQLASLDAPAAHDFLEYLSRFRQLLDTQTAQRGAELERMRTDTDAAQNLDAVNGLFDAALAALDSAVHAMGGNDAAPRR